MKLYRLIGIILILESEGNITAKELANRFEVSIRTIYRDLDILSQAAIPIVTESGPGGGISLIKGYQSKFNTLDYNEFSSMIKTLADYNIHGTQDQITQNMILKIRKALPNEIQNEFDHLLNSMKFDSTNWFGSKTNEIDINQILDLIKLSILKKKKLKFDYVNYQKISCNRILHPYGIVKKVQAWYLVGYCEERREVRIFNCIRIKNLTIEESIFKLPGNFNLDTFWYEAVNQFDSKNSNFKDNKEGKDSSAAFPITLWCHEKQRSVVDAFNILNEEQVGEYYLLTVDFINESIAMQQLILHLDKIILVEPESFKEKVLYKVQNISKTQNH